MTIESEALVGLGQEALSKLDALAREMGVRAEQAYPLLIEEVSRRGEVYVTIGVCGVVASVIALSISIVMSSIDRHGMEIAGPFLCAFGVIGMITSAIGVIASGAVDMWVSPNLYLIERILA